MIGDAERSKLQVGYKQAVRALNENKASKVFVAEDCDDHIKDGVSKIAYAKQYSCVLHFYNEGNWGICAKLKSVQAVPSY